MQIKSMVLTENLYVTPNPFSEKTTIKLNGIQLEDASIGIFTIEGKLLRKIPAGKMQHGVEWDGCDAAGMEVPPGVYLIRVADGQYNKTYKIVKR